MKKSAALELSWPREIVQGNKGPDVRRMQEWLCLHGCGISLDGDFGPATGVALKRFQSAHTITPTGVAALDTLHALCEPLNRAFNAYAALPTLRMLVAATAREHLAQRAREVGGDNRGPWVRAYCGADGAQYRWCAGFAMSIVEQACEHRGEAMPVGFTLGCDELAEFAQRASRLTHNAAKVRGGDLFLCRRGSDYYHVGIVAEMRADHFETIEGNSNDDHSANGYEVCANTRNLANKDFVLLS